MFLLVSGACILPSFVGDVLFVQVIVEYGHVRRQSAIAEGGVSYSMQYCRIYMALDQKNVVVLFRGDDSVVCGVVNMFFVDGSCGRRCVEQFE